MVTEFEYQRALKKLEFHQAEADKYRKITQQYFYEWDSVRVQQRKEDSEKFYFNEELKNMKNE